MGRRRCEGEALPLLKLSRFTGTPGSSSGAPSSPWVVPLASLGQCIHRAASFRSCGSPAIKQFEICTSGREHYFKALFRPRIAAFRGLARPPARGRSKQCTVCTLGILALALVGAAHMLAAVPMRLLQEVLARL